MKLEKSITALKGVFMVIITLFMLTYPSAVHGARGTVVAWGWDYFGQASPTEALSDVRAIAAGTYHSLALRSNGTVVGWGGNFFGQASPPAGLSGVITVTAGWGHSLALKADGTVVGWGYNYHGQASPPAGLSSVIAVAAGLHSLALKADGTVVGWGYDGYGQASPPAGLADVVAIATGEKHSLALKADGTVVGWGYNVHSQASPPAGLADVVAIAAGGNHSLALRSDGTVVGWGNNDYGQASPPAGLSNVIAIAAGSGHSLALKADGTVVGWGYDGYGQASSPAGLSNVVAIAAGGGHNLALVETDQEEARLWVNAGNSSGRMRSCVPDVGFAMDGDDEDCKQEVGFDFWWSGRTGEQLTLTDLTDVAPLVVTVTEEQLAEGARFYLQVEGDNGLESLAIYPAASTSANRLAYLQKPRVALRQALMTPQRIELANHGEPQLLANMQAGHNEFVFEAIGYGSATAQLKLLVEKPDAPGELLEQDWIRLNLNEPQQYWWFVSARGPSQLLQYEYAIEDGRTWGSTMYPVPQTVSGGRDPAKTKHLVYLHGFNTSQTEALQTNNDVFKRLYWLGFRGNYVGVTWEGDAGGILAVANFDQNAANAFKTAPSLMYFLRQLRAEVGAENVDVMAHSLGNLVMWEALRQHQAKFGEPLINNAIGVAPAIWSEAFDPPTWLQYTGLWQKFYSVEDLKVHSWRFWFNQPEHRAINALKGRAYNSYNPGDLHLDHSMRFNDWLWRGVDPTTADLALWDMGWIWRIVTTGRPWRHFNRDAFYEGFKRTPVSLGGHSLALRLPALLEPPDMRAPMYLHTALSLPVGATRNPLAQNYLALHGGWGLTAHADHTGKSLPRVYKWYKEFLADERAIAIGEE